MRIVVTGSRGFIGSCFSYRAKLAGHEVIAIDDESRGLNPIEEVVGIEYHKHDCRKGILEIVGDRKIDAVVHLAAATGSLDRPYDQLYDLNVVMCQTVYQDALRAGARAFAWPTTSLAIAVPDSPYVRSKEEALKKLLEVDAKAQISVPVRFFNVAGACGQFTERRRREVHAIPEMVKCFVEDKTFTVNGTDWKTPDGTPSRDFVNVNDVVDFLLYMIAQRIAGETLPTHPQDGAIWTGTGFTMTVREMVRDFQDAFGRLKVAYGERRAYDCAALIIDSDQCTRFRNVIRDLHGAITMPHSSLRAETKLLVRLCHEGEFSFEG